MEPEWKLGVDVHPDDNLFDPISFQDIILTLHCNEKVIDRLSASRCFTEILKQRLEDAEFLLENNMEEIIRRAKIGRAGYEQEEV